VDIYIDESGDIGLGPKSSPFFVIAALIIHQPLQIQRCFKKIRKNRLKKKLRELPELKFNNSDNVIKRRVLDCLATSDIEFWCSVLRKEQLYDRLRTQPQIVYNYLTGSLIANIYFHYQPFSEFNVIVDKSLNGIHKEQFDQYIIYKTMERHIPITGTLVLPKIIHVDSRRERVFRPQISLLALFIENIARRMTGSFVSSNINVNNYLITLKGRKSGCDPFPTLSHLPQGSLIRFGKDLLTMVLSYGFTIL